MSTLASSLTQAGLIAIAAGFLGILIMYSRALKRTKKGKATIDDMIFLVSITPGFSRFSFMNYPDTMGFGIYSALALEQNKALDDMKDFVEASLSLYNGFADAYYLAARYAALKGKSEEVADNLKVANKLAENQDFLMKLPQLDKNEIQKVLAKGKQDSTNSYEKSFDTLKKKPLRLMLARSVVVLKAGGAFLIAGVFLDLIADILR